jgi:hypothetical protein
VSNLALRGGGGGGELQVETAGISLRENSGSFTVAAESHRPDVLQTLVRSQVIRSLVNVSACAGGGVGGERR